MSATKFHQGQRKITHEIKINKIRLIKFPDYSNHTCVAMLTRTLLQSVCLQFIQFHQLELQE